jgi:hypothetical protein
VANWIPPPPHLLEPKEELPPTEFKLIMAMIEIELFRGDRPLNDLDRQRLKPLEEAPCPRVAPPRRT